MRVGIAEQVEAKGAAPLRKRRDHDVLARRQAIEQLIDLVALGQARLTDLGDAAPGNVAALENDRSRGRRDLAGEHLEESALARAIGADDTPQFSLLNFEINGVVCEEPAIALAQPLGHEDRTFIDRNSAAGRRLEQARFDRRICRVLRFPHGGAVTAETGVKVRDAAEDSASEERHEQNEYEAEHEPP